MSFNDVLFVSSTYLLIALAITIFAVFVLRIKFLGKFWLAFLVAIIGAVLGGIFCELINPVIEYLRNLNGKVNIFPPLFFSALFVWILAKLSKRNQ